MQVIQRHNTKLYPGGLDMSSAAWPFPGSQVGEPCT